jgi:competence protein ComEA
LEDLPGIGEVIAGRVVEYRQKTRFASIEDIKKVSGIGDAKYEQIKDLITVN